MDWTRENRSISLKVDDSQTQKPLDIVANCDDIIASLLEWKRYVQYFKPTYVFMFCRKCIVLLRFDTEGNVELFQSSPCCTLSIWQFLPDWSLPGNGQVSPCTIAHCTWSNMVNCKYRILQTFEPLSNLI